MIQEKITELQNGKLSAVDNVTSFLKVIDKKNKKINAFLYINKNALSEAKEIDAKIKAKKAGKLAGLVIAVKSCINVKGMPASCASETLKDYIATYDADAIAKIKAEDGIIIGMTNMDCFACGTSGESSMFGKTENPAAPGHIPGGSSSGSAAAVAAEMCDIALGTDTGGSIRNPASHCGVVGIKPSYGRVSRFGLIDLSMSFDQIGPLCKDVYGCALMMEVISGYSKNDSITYDAPVKQYSNFGKNEKLRIGVSKEFEKLCSDGRIMDLITSKIEELAKSVGAEIKEVQLKYLDLAIQTYYPINYVEFFSGTRKLDGRRYGKKIEESCSEEVLRRILGGKEISKAEHGGRYYSKSLQIMKLIKADFENAFKDVDVIIAPTTPKLPHKFGENLSVKDDYAYDAFTTPANLAGICAGVVPAGDIGNIPVGIQVFAPSLHEDLLFNTLKKLEDI